MNNKQQAEKNILTAFLLNFFFVIIELAGGLWTGSVAILSDAVHDFGDCAVIGLAFFLERRAGHAPDHRYTYGYRRFSVLSAVIAGLILLVGSGVVLYASVSRLLHPQAIYAPGMFWVAVAGVIINGLAVLRMTGGHKVNEKMIRLHMLEDVLGWVVVLAGSACIWLFNIVWLDPLLSIGVTAFILIQAIRNLKNAWGILLEKVPTGFDLNAYEAALAQTEGLFGLHHLHVWTLDGEVLLATLHAVVAESCSAEQLFALKKALQHTSEVFGIQHLTVQIDTPAACEDEHCAIHTLAAPSAGYHHAHGHTHDHHHACAGL